MRSLLFLTGFIVGCPSAPKVVIEGGLDESFVADEGEGTTDGDENSVDDTGDNADGGSEDGGSEDGGSEDGGSEDGGSEDGGSEDGGSEDGGSEGGSEDGDDIDIGGEYPGIMGEGNDETTCYDDTILYVDSDGSFFAEGTCDLEWGGDFGLFEMTFEGSFDDDGEASGTFTTGTLYGSETGEVVGNIDGSEIELSANFRVWGFGEVEAFFKTE